MVGIDPHLYVGLPGLDGLEYLEGDNWLGVALSALMRVPKERQAWLGAEALRRISEAPLTDQHRYLLGECIQTYAPFDKSQWDEFNDLLATKPYARVKKMRATWFDQGLEKGRQEGRQEGRRETLRELLEERFGRLPKRVQRRLQSLPAEQVDSLVKQVLQAASLRELGLVD